MTRGPTWSKDATAQLRTLYCVEGQPIAAICKVMGRTDWAIRGKIRYEKWPLPGGIRQKATQRGIAARVNRIRQAGPVFIAPANTRALKGAAWQPLPGTTPVSLIDLEPGMCKWPIGEGSPYLFCGTHAASGPYCEHHTARASKVSA